MKRIWHHPTLPETGKRYWRSLGERSESAEFQEWLEREFPEGASTIENDDVSRRHFVKLMGASAGLAGFGLASCRRPEAYLVPFAESVEWNIPGKPVYFASAMPRMNGCMPLVVTTYDGRPTKLDGNPLHPNNRVAGANGVESSRGSDVFTQAAILNLYDPDRSKHFLKAGERSTREDFEAGIAELVAGLAGGEGLGFLVGEGNSPTRTRLLGDLQIKFPAAKFYRYEAVNLDSVRQANASYFGKAGMSQVPRLDKATRVLSLESDFLGVDDLGSNVKHGFGLRRRADSYVDGAWKQTSSDEMARLYVVEAGFSVTGGMADHRLRVPSSQIPRVAAYLANKAGISGVDAPPTDGLNTDVLDKALVDLQGASGKAVVLAGNSHSKTVHLLVTALNEKLGAFGSTIDVVDSGDPGSMGDITQLKKDLDAGAVTTLISTTAADPVYDAPADLAMAESLAKATFIHLGESVNASAKAAAWHIPETHFLETWSDIRSGDGVYSVIQPMILPLYGGVSENDLFLKMLGEKAPDPAVPGEEAPNLGMVAVRKTFDGLGGSDAAWNQCLRDGFLAGSAYAAVQFSGGSVGSLEIETPAVPTAESLEVRFVPDNKVYDGRYVNNGWLQEMPDPITKMSWGNTAVVSVATQKALGIKRDGQRIRLSVNGREGYFPVQAIPGHADNTITIPLGYGQRDCGYVGYGSGFSAYGLRMAGSPFIARDAQVEVLRKNMKFRAEDPMVNHAPDKRGRVKIARWSELPVTQEHNAMEGRALVRDGNVGEYEKNPEFAKKRGIDSHIPPNISLYRPENREGQKFNDLDPNHQWAMTIDLNQCTGCNACMVACQAENNIPIVGKDQVLRGREMAWIRMDRYFADGSEHHHHDDEGDDHGHHDETKHRGVNILDEDKIEVLIQPVACQQCESAPCETVCPVNATVHSEDGLNAMAYNRCIGTRYCANNCPYKARRFNFFDYNKRPIDELYLGPLSSKKGLAESLQLQKNPNVSVRMRGVMEKCTYCVQRIQEAKIARKVEVKASPDVQVGKDVVKTACQESCPSEAIVFGNLKREDDTVNAYKASPRNYDLLSYVGTRPRTSYLARVKNPNPEITTEVGQISAHLH